MKKIKQYLIMFLTMFKIGAFTFGGGYAMISLIRREVVEKKKWITDEELIDMITIAESTPGPIAINMATFVGYRVGKILGSIVSSIGVVVPSFVIIILISTVLENIMEYEVVKAAFIGINCAVSILIGFALTTLFKNLKKNVFSFILLILSFIATFLIMFFKLNFSTIFIIIIGSFASLIYYYLKNYLEKTKKEKAND